MDRPLDRLGLATDPQSLTPDPSQRPAQATESRTATSPPATALDLGVVAVGAGPHLPEHVPLVGVTTDDVFHVADDLLGNNLDVVLFVARQEMFVLDGRL